MPSQDMPGQEPTRQALQSLKSRGWPVTASTTALIFGYLYRLPISLQVAVAAVFAIQVIAAPVQQAAATFVALFARDERRGDRALETLELHLRGKRGDNWRPERIDSGETKEPSAARRGTSESSSPSGPGPQARSARRGPEAVRKRSP
jgi:hypothetical protein